MLAFPSMLIDPARQAGIKVPENVEEYDRLEFPHFWVFCQTQLGRHMSSPNQHWENAKVIASISDDEIKLVTKEGLEAKGFDFS